MTQITALALLRARLHEVSEGYYSNNTLYSYLDNSQLKVIDDLLFYRSMRQAIEPFYEPNSLRPLIVHLNINLVSGTPEYSYDGGNNNFRETLGAKLKYSAGTYVRATYKPYIGAQWANNNIYQSSSVTDPIYYISGVNIGFQPVPNANHTPGAVHSYYKTPATVGAAQNFTLTSETHNAIVAYALYIALLEDQRAQDAQLALQEYQSFIKQIQ